MRRLALVLTALAVGAATAAPSDAAGKSLPFSLTYTDTCIAPQNVVVLADCDGDNTRSYVQETVPKGGPIDVQGTTFVFPASGMNVKDTVFSSGQTIAAPAGATGYKSVALLAAAREADPAADVSFVVTYTDGSKTTVKAKVANWLHGANKRAISTVRTQWIAWAYSSISWSNEGTMEHVLLPVNSKKTVKSVTLPTQKLMIWSISMSPLASLPKSGPIFN